MICRVRRFENRGSVEEADDALLMMRKLVKVWQLFEHDLRIKINRSSINLNLNIKL
jgi:hypothetical protein